MEARYRPEDVEERWQRTWEEEGLYNAEASRGGETFVVAHPPPNVTGELHTGHALQLALADALVRYHRMRGFNTLFQTGYDHAGISTQSVVEKHLESQGKRRQDLGRVAFVELVWDWLHRYGRTIMTQFRRMGASMDYRRERFTMDPDYTRAVMRFFVHLWEKGYLYRAHRIVNWCPSHQSALSDLELDHVEVDDELVYVRYPFADGSGGVTIATARPATILADVAVAVHPEDERYRDVVGKKVKVPVGEWLVPVITDERVDPGFGSGALKVTPGHDPKDYEIGRDHGLDSPMVVRADGRMDSSVRGFYGGLTQKEAADRILAWCEERGLLEKREPYRHTISVCERCGSRIEPLISLQWWCRMDKLKQPALEALRRGRVRYHPPSQHDFAIESLENAPDWNISRQLWWGHQLPVWYCPSEHVTVAESEPERCAECGTTSLNRDPDVLDTWFSSALWPFATLGWPDDTDDLRVYYPGSLNTTAREIIRLWENRMIFSGLELLGDVPFRDVIIHSTVLAPDGRRMSKSLGTGLDPLEVVAKHGADATRYGLLKISSTQDVRFSFGAVEEGWKLANKLWNASRLILGTGPQEAADRPTALEERWILARLSATQRAIEAKLAAFDFAHLVAELYHLTFDDFCDWYLEAIKPRLYAGDADAQATALAALERLLKLLHPVMPHVTEEIWASLPLRTTRLIVSAWPEAAAPEVDHDELERARIAARIYRRSGVRVDLAGDAERIFEAVVRPSADGRGDVEAERGRVRAERDRVRRKLDDERFTANARPEVVSAEREKLVRYEAELDALGG